MRGAVLEEREMVQTEGIEPPDRKRIREVNLYGYKYLGELQLDSVMNRKMSRKVQSEYIKRVKKIIRSQLNRKNVMAGMNAWAVGIIRYGAEVLDWTKEELKSIDIKTRKLITMNGRLYLARKERGGGLISCEKCVNMEVQSLDRYLSQSKG